MPKSSTHPKKTNGKFSHQETAWILNWNDHCLIKGLKFQHTICEALEKKLGTVRSWEQISNKLRSILRAFLKRGHKLNVHDVLKEGTRCFRVEWYEEELLEQLNLGRDELGIPRLGEGYTTECELRAVSIGTRPHAVPTNGSCIIPSVVPELKQLNTVATEDMSALEDLAATSGTRSSNSTDDIHELDPFWVQDHSSRMTNACPACRKSKRKCAWTSELERCDRCAKSRRRCTPQPLPLKRESSHQMNSTQQKKKPRVHDTSLYPTHNTHTPLPGSYQSTPELQILATGIDSAPGVSFSDISLPQSTIEKQEKQRYQWLSVVTTDLMNMMDSGKPITLKMVQRLRIVKRTIENEEPDDVLKKLIGDLAAADKHAAKCRNMLDALIGGQSFVEKVEFPTNPSRQSIDQDWHAIRKEIIHSTRTEHSGPLPSQELLGYFVSALYCLLEDQYPEESVLKWSSSKESELLENRCVLQTLLCALVCHRVFVGSMSLFDGEHPGTLMNTYSLIDMHDGIEAVRNTDMRATKMFIANKAFQEDIIPREATVMSSHVGQLLQKQLNSQTDLSNDDSFYQVCKKFIHFRLKLMISTVDYGFVYCQPGAQYDSTWMEAEDEDGRPLKADVCNAKKIRLCLFPGVVQHQKDLDPDDITAVFACNKRFSFGLNVGEVIDPEAILSKAVVLMER